MKLINYIDNGIDKITVGVLWFETVYYFEVHELTKEAIEAGLEIEKNKQEDKLKKIQEINQQLQGKDITF